MRLIRLILVFGVIAASVAGAGEVVAAQQTGDACCCESKAAPVSKDCDDGGRHCHDSCLLACCRTATAPAEPVVTKLTPTMVSSRVIVLPPLVRDFAERDSIFHPPRG